MLPNCSVFCLPLFSPQTHTIQAQEDAELWVCTPRGRRGVHGAPKGQKLSRLQQKQERASTNDGRVGGGLGVSRVPGQSKAAGLSSPQACVLQILGLLRTEKALGLGHLG